MEKLTIDKPVLEKLLNYIASKPFLEVNDIIKEVAQNIKDCNPSMSVQNSQQEPTTISE